ncbi:MAG: sigma 54-interacting transcriptional regulator [Phycisphaerae bacterium]|nr:sigma 54-interacting transcriptional regulator [Phycisphaerae bacterium]
MSTDTEATSVRVLTEISHILGSTLELRTVFDEIMQILAAHLGIESGRLVLLDELGDGLRIVAAYGLTPDERRRGRYALGEGITGKVVASGQGRVVADVSTEADFLNRTRALRDRKTTCSFICLPIVLETQVLGALGVDIPFVDAETLSRHERLLTIVTAIIAQALQINRMVMHEKKELVDELTLLRQNVLQRYQLENIIGQSAPMLEVFKTISQIAATRATVLLLGETGTGKELIAKAIHFNSDRKDGPFIRVNCGALSGTLLESELFGHVRGAFTGALRDKVGRFEAADGGTLFLDEIATLDMSLQVKLLRVLQEREFERVGDAETRRVDVRLLAAANLDLAAAVQAGRFREDLFYRLNVVTIRLPALRERREDIPRLIDFFLDKYNAENGRSLRRISRELLSALLRYPWPGNVRELENAIERAVVLSNGESFTEALLPLAVRAFVQAGRHRSGTGTVADLTVRLVQQSMGDHALDGGGQPIWATVISRMERALIQEALHRTGGVKLKAAVLLGINRNTLNKKCRELGIVATTRTDRDRRTR